ncbi:MAG: DUF3568 family protein [Planctomycetota bacterium]|jgi:hypothetical protein
MRKEQVFLILALAGMGVVAQGCTAAWVGVGVGAGAGTIAYLRGDLEAVEPNNIDTVFEATEKAIEELELKVSKKTKDKMSALIIARDAQDKKVTIKLSAAVEGSTRLSIRIGMFGNETKSRIIYQKIREKLERL